MIAEELKEIEKVMNRIKEEETKKAMMEIVTEEKATSLDWEVSIRFNKDSWSYEFEVACEDAESAKKREDVLRKNRGVLRTTEKKLRGHIYSWVENKMKKCVRTMKVKEEGLKYSLSAIRPYNYSMMEWDVKEVPLDKAVIEVIEEKNIYIIKVSGPISKQDFSEIKAATYIHDGHIFCLMASSERQEGRVLSVYTKEYAKFYEIE